MKAPAKASSEGLSYLHISVGRSLLWYPPYLITKHQFMKQNWMMDLHAFWVISKGQFTHHGRWPFPKVRLHGPTSVVQFLKKPIYKAFGPLTTCKPNVDQEEWPCIKKWMCWIFKYMSRKGIFEKKESSLTILLPFFVHVFSSPKKKSLNIFYYNNISLPRPLPFSIITLFLPLPPRNMLDHVSG